MAFKHPPKKILTAKLWLYSLGGFIASVLAFFLLLFPARSLDPNGLAMFVLMSPPFAFVAVGGLWMMKTALLQEPKPLPLIVLASTVPFAFLWYYFERVRPSRLTRPHGPLGQD